MSTKREKHDLIFGRDIILVSFLCSNIFVRKVDKQGTLSSIQHKGMQDIQVKVKVNSQIEGGELTAAVPPSKKMNQDTTQKLSSPHLKNLPSNAQNLPSKTKEVAPIVFQPPPATEELVKGKEEESSVESAPASKKLTSSTGGVAQDEKLSKKVNDDANKIGSAGEVQARKKQKVKEAPPKFNPGVGLGYDNNNMLTPFGGMSGLPPMAYPPNQHHPSFNHHMYGSSSYPWKAIHRGVGGAYPMYPQTSAPNTAHRAPMYGQAILQTVSTDSQTDAKKEMKDEIKDELAVIKKDVTMMKDMVSHLLIQNKELLIQNKELMEKIGN